MNSERKGKSAKPRCVNCGDETCFPENSDAFRVQQGFCVPCHRKSQTFVPFDRPVPGGPDGFWSGEDRTIYRSNRFNGTIKGPCGEETP